MRVLQSIQKHIQFGRMARRTRNAGWACSEEVLQFQVCGTIRTDTGDRESGCVLVREISTDPGIVAIGTTVPKKTGGIENMKVSLVSKSFSQYRVYKDRWLGDVAGNCETREAMVLKFDQLFRIEDPHIPKGVGSSVQGWPSGSIEIVLDAKVAGEWTLGCEYELAIQ
jgi:hypothetical protein